MALVIAMFLGPIGLVIAACAVWVFICLSARRLHDLRLPGRLALAPVVALALLAGAYFYLGLVTKGFCQGYCANASGSSIAALDWVEDYGLSVLGWTCLAFLGLLAVLPGRNPTTTEAADFTVEKVTSDG